MDDHDQLKFFFSFILFFVWRWSARKRIIQFAMLNRMERRRRRLVSLLPAFALVVSHELENQSIAWTAILVDSEFPVRFGNLVGAKAFLEC